MATQRSNKPRKTPRQARSAQTRQRILNAAARVFGEHGYAAGTTNRIADDAGLSIGSLYQYFPNKDAILLELMTAHAESGMAMVAARLEAGLPESLEDALRLFVRATIDNHLEEPRLHQVMFEQAPRPAEFLVSFHQTEAMLVATTADLLKTHSEVGVQDVDTAARMVVATIESLTHRLIATTNRVDDVRLENEMVAMLSAYLRGAPSIRPATNYAR